MKNLPIEWQIKVITEEAKLNKSTWLVRVSGTPHMISHELIHLLSDYLGEALPTFDTLPRGAIIHCGTASLPRKILGLKGWSLDGHPLKCSILDNAMSSDLVNSFITDKLQQEQKLLMLRKTLENPIKT